MPPLLCGKGALAPDLTFIQCLQILRLPASGEMPLNRGLEIAVLQLSCSGPIRFAQALIPQWTAGTVFLVRPVFPNQSAAAAV